MGCSRIPKIHSVKVDCILPIDIQLQGIKFWNINLICSHKISIFWSKYSALSLYCLVCVLFLDSFCKSNILSFSNSVDIAILLWVIQIYFGHFWPSISLVEWVVCKGEKADSVYPGYGDNPHNPYNPEDTVAIQPISSRSIRYARYIADTKDTTSFNRKIQSI